MYTKNNNLNIIILITINHLQFWTLEPYAIIYFKNSCMMDVIKKMSSIIVLWTTA